MSILGTKSSLLKTSIGIAGFFLTAMAAIGLVMSNQPAVFAETNGGLQEADQERLSDSNEWWLEAGGLVHITDTGFKTLHGPVADDNQMRLKYAEYSSRVSDNGYHPQNSFRLYNRNSAENKHQEMTATVDADNLYNRDNVQPWNGLSQVMRFQDSDDYYFAEIRMDGKAVIKRVHDGLFTTLAAEKIFPGEYDAMENHNLIPLNTPIHMTSDITTTDDGNVEITFTVDVENDGNVEGQLSVVDDGSRYANDPLTKSGKSGVYSDYMEMTVTDYSVNTASADQSNSTDQSNTEPNSSTGGENEVSEPVDDTTNAVDETTETTLSSYGLDSNGTIEEAGSMGSSKSSDWWVNSGGYFYVEDGVGHSVLGDLPNGDYWQEAYASANPVDTEDGHKPQNILRLVTRDTFTDYTQQAQFQIDKYNETDSPNRQGHNGILFFNRYHDGDNLYYTGIRVDGRAVIKKKQNGQYYTLAYEPVYQGEYNRSSNPNLLPENQWIGLKSVVNNNSDGSVTIEVYLDKENNGEWQRVAKAIDDGSNGSPITEGAHAGIRGDFMDLKVKEYRIE